MIKEYRRLTDFLNKQNQSHLILTYEDIEGILTIKLPHFSDKDPHRFWNNNGRNSYFRMWNDAGFLAKVEPKERRVRFYKGVLIDSNKDSKKITSQPQEKEKAFEIRKIFSEEIETVHKAVLDSLNYGKEIKIIHDVFNRFPLNNDLNIIAMKIAVIDVTNSTSLAKYKKTMSLYDLANIVLQIENFDLRVASADPNLVNEIAKASKNVGKVNLFSFASKYCCYHNTEIYGRDDYSIYDSLLKDNLNKYIHGLTKTEITQFKEKYEYKKFNDIIGTLLDESCIDIPFRRRKFDHYVWSLGKADAKKRKRKRKKH